MASKAREKAVDLDLDYARSIISYEPETGLFLWKKRVFNHKKYAGTIDWHRGYRKIVIDQVVHHEHRLAWFLHYGEYPKDPIDHINGNGYDNRICNLRLASTSKNNQNQYRPDNSTGCRNVYRAPSGSFYVTIKAFRKNMYIGSFDNLELADLVAIEARDKYHGEFAYERRFQ